MDTDAMSFGCRRVVESAEKGGMGAMGRNGGTQD
jgi:hypothetical protein